MKISQFAVRSSVIALALSLGAPAFVAPAFAQAAADEEADDASEIVVTGSSLKGVAPVGSTLTTVGRAEIDETGVQTVQQLLKTVPAVVGLQSTGQGGFGSFDGAGTNAPTIHGLGASASNSTLILLNGHRMPVSGVNHVLADPNIIAPLAMERVEVLADGASSVYGSDAVAGVINFITRRNVNGFEATVQKGFGNNYGTFNAGALWGTTWDSGSFLVSYNFSSRENLAAADRSFASINQTARGGRNFQSTVNRCSPASVTANGVTLYTPYATTSTTVAGDCDPSRYWDLVPSEKRHNVLASVRQEVSDALTLTADFIYSDRKNVQNVTRGSASGNISAANPYFVSRSFVNSTTNVTTTPATYGVNFNGDQLLGPGATITGTAETFYGRFDAVYALSDAWEANVGGIIGRDKAQLINRGQLNGSVFNLALNGTTTAAINGVNTTATRALTAATALNPFGTGTSAATIADLTNNDQLAVGDQTIKNAYIKVAGDLFPIGGESAKIAVGGEITGYKLRQNIVRPNNLGVASANSAFLNINYNRSVKSVYAELFLPLVTDGFVRRFEVILSGRHDSYSDVGGTTNPKIAANLEIAEGVKFRGNWAKSFVAPALTSSGANAQGLTGESGFTGINGGGIPGGSPTLLLANFPTASSIPGAVCTATSCTIGTVNGVLVTGGNGNLKPQTGTAFSVGVDLAPTFMPGFTLAVTYWSNRLRGGITAPLGPLALGAADLSHLLQIYPAGNAQAASTALTNGLPQNGVINPLAYFSYNFQQNNILNLNVTGLDVAANYRFETGIGRFDLGASLSRKLKFDQFFGQNGAVFSVLGVSGFNGTFPSVKFEGRANVGYSNDAFRADVFVNHLGSYTNWSGTVANPVTRVAGVPTGGGDPVKAFTTVDLNLSYKFKNISILNEAQIFLDATNLFNTAPPQFNAFNTNGSVGYDFQLASPIGRVITVGLRTKF